MGREEVKKALESLKNEFEGEFVTNIEKNNLIPPKISDMKEKVNNILPNEVDVEAQESIKRLQQLKGGQHILIMIHQETMEDGVGKYPVECRMLIKPSSIPSGMSALKTCFNGLKKRLDAVINGEDCEIQETN